MRFPSVILLENYSGTLYYEKFQDGSVKEVEVPYELPEGWAWTRLGNIGTWRSGATPKKSKKEYYTDGTIPWLLTGDLTDGLIRNVPNKITELALKESSVKINPIGSVLIAMYGATIGRLGILTFPSTTNQACCACLPFEGVKNEFLFYYLMAHKKNFIDKAEGGAQPNISRQKIVATKFILPPYNEQRLIVKEIKKHFSLINIIETEQESLNQLSEQLKKKVLDTAMRGQLVPQDPNDEPASVLLEKIREEKLKLFKEGKLKKRDLEESVIYKGDDNSYYQVLDNRSQKVNVPFEVPCTWHWEKIGHVTTIVRGGSPRPIKNFLTDAADGINWIKIGDAEQDGKYITSTKEKIIKKGLPKTRMVYSGDFLLSNSMSFGRPYITKIDGAIHDGWLAISNFEHIFTSDFLYYYLSSSTAFAQFTQKASGTAVKNLNRDKVASTWIPIPPLGQQKRIVNELEGMFESLNKLI